MHGGRTQARPRDIASMYGYVFSVAGKMCSVETVG